MIGSAGIGLLLLAEIASSVEVRGQTECPSATELSAALVGLVDAGNSPGPVDVAELRGRGSGLSVRLIDARGDVVAERILPPAPSCAERARTAAVIVAAWEARLRAGLQGALAVPARERAPEAPAPAARPLAPFPTPPVARSTPPSTSGVAASVSASPSSASAPPLDIEPGAALLASVVAREVAAAALAEVSFSRPGARFAFGLGALAVNTHAIELGTGLGTWRRLGGVIDARARARLGLAALELTGGVILSALLVDGRSLPKPAGATLFDAGGLLGLRVKTHLGAISPWIAGTVLFWPAGHSLYVAGSTASADLPSVEALLGLGVSFDAGR